jgi:RHS repeat-associated protein
VGTITAVRHFVWGPDIAGQQSASLESGAEGVGGLLLIREWKPATGLKQYLPLTDGLGNITGLLDATNGSLVAEFDYDPYGNPVIESITQSGNNAITQFSTCPFRHRTRYYDSESWLYYYGYRYYDPSTTKWISKDPLEEEGGWNLTSFCENDPVNEFDPLGLAGYFFGGTGNSLEEEGISNVEILYLAWKKKSNGEAYYVPGVWSGYLPNGKKVSSPWLPHIHWLWLGPLYGVQWEYTSKILEAAVGKTTGSRVDQMMEFLEQQLENGDKTVNVFGFSRGATSALEFLNRIRDQIKARNPLYRNIKINYVALWDTVKSTAVDYRTELPKGMQFQHRPLHFIAIDERRKDFFSQEVLNIQGALQIGFRGVHSDDGNGYRDGALGWPSLDVAVRSANLIGLQFNGKTIDKYAGTFDLSAKPSKNSTWYYREGDRMFPKDMYLDPSVQVFNESSQPLNDISNLAVLPENALIRWKRSGSYSHK